MDNGDGDPGRDESTEQRADRRWNDLLQEVRVAQTGVQILFGFLLTVAFQQRFGTLSTGERHLYVVTVVLAAAATDAFVGPVAVHRLLTGHRMKPETVALASRLTVLGLFLLLCTMACSLLLVLRVAAADTTSLWVVSLMVVWFALCRLGFPLWARRHTDPVADEDVRPSQGPAGGR